MIVANLCPTCDRPITGRPNKRFCDDDCRWDFHNAEKSEPRLAVIEAQGGICAFPGCKEKASRYYEDLRTDICPHGHALCEFHSAGHKRWKRRAHLTEVERLTEDQTQEIEEEKRGYFSGLRTGGAKYYGYKHISMDDATGLDVYRYDPISELVDYLSGENDEIGNALFHPLDEAA